MKIKWKGMEIECTPDEFEELYARGILMNKDTAEEALHKEYNLNNPQDHKILVTPEKPRDPFPTVAVYGCNMPDSWGPGPLSSDITARSSDA